MDVISKLIARACEDKQRIVLPEGTEERTLKAADKAIADGIAVKKPGDLTYEICSKYVADGIAELIILGNKAEILALAEKFGLANIKNANIIDPDDNPDFEKYSNLLYELRKSKGLTIEEAQNVVMTSLLNKIASSVAVQVTGEIVNDVDWTTVGDKEVYIEKVTNNTTTKIAKMPALQGISLTKADVYWERYINKKTKETCYDYYILYPFTSHELQELIDIYNAQEKALNARIDDYRLDLNEADNIDGMLEEIEKMKTMMAEMGKDDVKYTKLQSVVKLYEKAIKDVYVEVVENYNENNRGTIVIQLKHDERVMKTKSLPQLRGNCARDFTKKHDGNKIILNFSTYDCYEQDDNYVEVHFSFGKRKLVKKVKINI